MEISRRELFKLLGVSGAAAAAGVWGGDRLMTIPDEVFERVVTGPRLETWKTGVCSLCSGGCGVRVRLIDDIPVRVTGNPLYPLNRGAVCPMAEAGIEELFHPHRIRQPLRRVGRKSDRKWEEISWDEADKILAERIGNLRSEGSPERLAVLSRDDNGLMTGFLERFMQLFGSPNHFSLSDSRIGSLPARLTQGVTIAPVHDLPNTRYVLNFGAELLDDPPSPVRMNQIYADLRSREGQTRAGIVHISSYLSRTASNSSRWIPINPGTGAALALGLAYVMIKDESYDRDFVAKQCQGFRKWKDVHGQWHDGFEGLVTSYYPERVAELTGVPAEKIVKLAREFAAAEPALALAGKQASHSTNGLYSVWAIHCLNALKGNLGKPGGLLFPDGRLSLSPTAPELDEVARAGLAQPKVGLDESSNLSIRVDSLQQLVSGLQQTRPYKIETLLVHRVNPLRESINHEQCRAALQRVPFLICSTSFLNETAEEADLILPEPVFLERWEISCNNPAVEFSHFGVQHPVIEPLFDTRQLGDTLLHLAGSLPAVADAFPWDSYEDYLKSCTERVYQSNTGMLVSENVELSWLKFLKERGWRSSDYSDFDEFWELLLDRGGWWDPSDPTVPAGKRFQTESGKFEFYSHTLQRELADTRANSREGSDLDLIQSWKIEASGDSIFLPHFERPRFSKDPVEFPLHLLVCPLIADIGGEGSHLSLLQELRALESRTYWRTWVEINPETAARIGVKEADHVDIISLRGRLAAEVRISPAVMPETVVVPMGSAGTQVGRFGRLPETNPFALFVEETDRMTGIESLISTRVRVERTHGGSRILEEV